MAGTMTAEIFWLALTTILTPLLIVPYAVVRVRKIGIVRAFTNPLPGDDPFDQAWAHRAYRSHMNAIENLVVFAPLALAVFATGSSNDVTAGASAIYFFARLVHAPTYVLNTPFARTISIFVGLGACFVLAYELLAQAI